MKSFSRWLSPSVSGALPAPAQPVLIAGIVLLNQVFNAGATIAFALSGKAEAPSGFVVWQILGGILGLGIQITFAGMVRFFSLQFANAVGIGLAFLSAQIVGALLFFREPFSPLQWLGSALVFVGILFIAAGH
ncbi:MAG: hypothetical protein ACM3JD_07565 [Rudaea sp.]